MTDSSAYPTQGDSKPGVYGEPGEVLLVDDLDLLCDRFPSGTEVHATTWHGTHLFAVARVEQDAQGRVLLRLRTLASAD